MLLFVPAIFVKNFGVVETYEEQGCVKLVLAEMALSRYACPCKRAETLNLEGV
jgi:hypothetical protein